MDKDEALNIFKLLSALESWAFSQPDSRRLPDYLVEDIANAMKVLRCIVLENNNGT
jgi:hypothetical protein